MSFEEQKSTRYIRGNVYFGIIVFNCLSSTKPCLIFILIWFAREIKGFYQSSLGNEVGFRDIMNVSPGILAKNQNFEKLRHDFVDERVINIFSSLKNLSNFLAIYWFVMLFIHCLFWLKNCRFSTNSCKSLLNP